MASFPKPSVDFMKKKLDQISVVTAGMSDFEIEQVYELCQQEHVLDRFFVCGKKEKYGWVLPATKKAYLLTEFRKREFEPYKCPYCSYWHIGRKKERK